MYRLTHILIILALPIVGMAQICIEDSEAEFTFSDTINDFSNCNPNVLSMELIACELNYIHVTLSGVDDPDMLVIDILRPGAECPVRFASPSLIYSDNGGLLDQCPPCVEQITPWTFSEGNDLILYNVLGGEGNYLTGNWFVGLSYMDSWIAPNEISLDFVGSCCLSGGCTETSACNYDPNATSDDGSCLVNDECGVCGGDGSSCGGECDYGLTYISVGGGYWDAEIYWDIVDADGVVVADGGATEGQQVCLNPWLCYTLNMEDSYGDGWNGAIYTITGGDIFGSGDLDTATNGDGENYGSDSIGGSCEGECADEDADGICDDVDDCVGVYDNCGVCNGNGICYDVIGCTYDSACNYNAEATLDDGSCDYTSCIVPGCTYPNACNYNADATSDDGSCTYSDDPCYDCDGAIINDEDGDGICDYQDYSSGMEPMDNPFLEMSYVQNASPFFSFYDGWFDADFVKVGICRPQAILEPSSINTQELYISITFEDSDVEIPIEVPNGFTTEFQQELILPLPSGVNALSTASQIVSIRLQDDSGNTLDNLYQDGTAWPHVTLDGINHAPGQHRIVRQPWVLQGNDEVNESEWLVCDENWDMPFYCSWNLEPTIYVPLDPNSQGCQNYQDDVYGNCCLNDIDGDGICDELEIPVYCQDVNAINFSPLYNNLICEEAELMEYWISSFNLAEIAEQGGLLPPMESGQQPVASEMVASDICAAGASKLAFCNYGQRAFVVNENTQSVQIIYYGDLANPSPIDDGSGGFLSILAEDMSTELSTAGVPNYESLVPADVDIYNPDGQDDVSYGGRTMVAVAWMDTLSLINSGWVTFHNTDGILFAESEAIQQVGPTPRSLAFSRDGKWLVVGCSGEGEHLAGADPKAEIVCIDVWGYIQESVPDWTAVESYSFNFDDGSHIVGGTLAITGPDSRTSIYSGPNSDLSHVLEPSHVAITPDSDRAFVNCQVNNTLVEVDLDNVTSTVDVIQGAYGFGHRDMSSGSGFDGQDDGVASVEQPTEMILGWYQPGDMEIAFNGTKTILLTANEGLPSNDDLGNEDVVLSTSTEYSGLEIDSEYGLGAGSGDSYVFGSRSFSLWDISSPGAVPTLIYDSGSLIEETLAELMPEYANSLKSTYDSGDEASVSRGPEPAGIALGTLNDKDILIVSLEEMGGSMIFNLIDWENTPTLSVSYQAYATNRDFQNEGMDQCAFNHLGAKDVLFLHSTITDNNTWIPGGVNEGYQSLLVSNDETGSLTLFSLADNLKIPGCTDSCACNYNENATLNDGSCEFDSCIIAGCTDSCACNYDVDATLNDGTCESDSCVIAGCTDSCACNYDIDATLNDGTCDFDSCVSVGCTYSDADNYNPAATHDDGSCIFSNASPCPADLNGDGSVTTSDLLIFLGAFGTVC
jgi:hypothetical protein